jgi:hypothetical protein
MSLGASSFDVLSYAKSSVFTLLRFMKKDMFLSSRFPRRVDQKIIT